MTSGSAHTIRAMVSDLDDCLNAVDEDIDDEAYESDWHDEISDPAEAELENESGSWRIDPSTDAQTVVNPTGNRSGSPCRSPACSTSGRPSSRPRGRAGSQDGVLLPVDQPIPYW